MCQEHRCAFLCIDTALPGFLNRMVERGLAVKYCRDIPRNINLEATAGYPEQPSDSSPQRKLCSLGEKALSTNMINVGCQMKHRRKKNHMYLQFENLCCLKKIVLTGNLFFRGDFLNTLVLYLELSV